MGQCEAAYARLQVLCNASSLALRAMFSISSSLARAMLSSICIQAGAAHAGKGRYYGDRLTGYQHTYMAQITFQFNRDAMTAECCTTKATHSMGCISCQQLPQDECPDVGL